jgi:predicted DNA-binding protein
VAVILKPVETRVEEETHEKLVAIAKKNRRSIASELRILIDRHIEESEQKAAA